MPRLFVHETDGSLTGGTILETEAYTAEDAASHTFRGQTPRNAVMFGPAGHIYVYFTYGMHWCLNIVTGPAGHGQGVLIRAINPEQNLGRIRERRHFRPEHELTNGPAKVCQALGVTGIDNGAELNGPRFILQAGPRNVTYHIQATPRIGIRKDTHRLWRFVAISPDNRHSASL
jgi:DNA-3-methyladenine glycosylase